LIFLGCTCWGFDNHFTALIDGISPAQTTFWKGIVAGTFNLVIGGVIAGQIAAYTTILYALSVGALSYGISITLYVIAAQGIGAIRSQMIFSSAPFFGLLLSVTVLGEAFTGGQLIASVLMVISLVIVFSERHGHIHQHRLMSHQHIHSHDDPHHNHEHDDLHANGNHSHWHEHHPMAHDHKHWPDLHHRHGHKDNEKS
jgi:drug/metabolite transporter (DMT)-like permease